MRKPYERKIYFAMALDPIHIGTGGYTLGRVDNPILRDSDGVPKIPGTSIEGVCRTYEYLQGLGKNVACAKGKKTRVNGKEIQPCGECYICEVHGFTREDRSRQGLALFSDAKVLFFSVASLAGPVWITCPGRLKELNVNQSAWQDLSQSEFCMVSKDLKSKLNKVGYLNLGWVLLRLKKNGEILTHNITSETTFEIDGIELKFKDRGLNLEDVFKRLVIVSDYVFSQIVNSNLEIRTSVSIDPITGAAEEGALFTYEAIPRATIFYFDVTYQRPEHFRSSLKLEDAISTVETGFKLFESLGVGGMGTRGFGRLKVFGLDGRLDIVKLNEIYARNLLDEVRELEGMLKEAKPEEKHTIEARINKLKERIRQANEEFQKLASIWEKVSREVEK